MKVITNMNSLKAMQRRGLIKFDRATGEVVRHWTGRPVKACYVSDYGNNAEYPRQRTYVSGAGSCFEYKGNYYTLKYFDGCFCPFVVMINGNETLPPFV